MDITRPGIFLLRLDPAAWSVKTFNDQRNKKLPFILYHRVARGAKFTRVFIGSGNFISVQPLCQIQRTRNKCPITQIGGNPILKRASQVPWFLFFLLSSPAPILKDWPGKWFAHTTLQHMMEQIMVLLNISLSWFFSSWYITSGGCAASGRQGKNIIPANLHARTISARFNH